jgi:hypothetical protein
MSAFWKHSFGSAPIDEVDLADIASRIVDEHRFSPERPKEVIEVCKAFDDNVAAAVLYQYLSENMHAAFIADIDSRPAKKFYAEGKTKLLVVPGFFYEEHTDIGAGGDVVLAAGAACGFEVDRIALSSLGKASENVDLLRVALEREQHPDVWLVSFSKAAAEVRLLMQQMGDRFPKNIRGWISVSGTLGGSPLATIRFQSPLHELFYGAIFRSLGTRLEVIRELRHDHEYWQDEFVAPNAMQCIHIVGVPLLSHVQPILVPKHQFLSEYGVNDGISLLEDTMEAPGHLYPIWGADHFLRTPALSPLLYRLLHFAASQR